MSAPPPRAFSTSFKESVVSRLRAGERLAAVAHQPGIQCKLLYQWRHAYRSTGAPVIAGDARLYLISCG
jgi:transposase-like protein